MTKKGKREAKNSDHMMIQKLHHVERQLAKVAPPKVENEEFTVLTTITLRADSGTVAGLPRIGRIAVTGNGYYFYATTSSTPTAPASNIAQVEQVDRRFAMYKYWTPLLVKIDAYPHVVDYQSNNLGTGGQTLVHRPWATVKDLDIRAERELRFWPSKGKKPFRMHAPKTHFTETYPNLDRIALQKQQKQMFKTNGSWNAREQLRDPAGICLWTVSPTQTTLDTFDGFGTVVVEFRIRLSERNVPGAEMVQIPRPIFTSTLDAEQPQVCDQAQQIQQLEAELAKLRQG